MFNGEVMAASEERTSPVGVFVEIHVKTLAAG
jgi:hypothetical protein